jgi:repressor LexA
VDTTVKVMPLSPRQQRVFNFIKGFIECNGEAPTIAEIQERFEYRSPATVHRIVSILVDEGLLKRTPLIARGLRVVEQVKAA